MAIGLSLITEPQAMEVELTGEKPSVTIAEFQDMDSALDTLTTDIKGAIFQTVVETYAESCFRKELSYANFLSIVSVCKFRLFNHPLKEDEYNTIKTIYRTAFSKAYEVSENDYKDCLTHLNGKVFFLKDDPVKKVELRFAELQDPFRGEFDLSMCIHPEYGKMDQYFRLLPGCRAKNENIGKTEIRFTPLFWIKKELQKGAASYLRDVYLDSEGKWKDNAQVGIYMAWGRDVIKIYACLTTENCDSISSKSLGDNFFYKTDQGYCNFNKNVQHLYATRLSQPYIHTIYILMRAVCISCHFVYQNKTY